MPPNASRSGSPLVAANQIARSSSKCAKFARESYVREPSASGERASRAIRERSTCERESVYPASETKKKRNTNRVVSLAPVPAPRETPAPRKKCPCSTISPRDERVRGETRGTIIPHHRPTRTRVLLSSVGHAHVLRSACTPARSQPWRRAADRASEQVLLRRSCHSAMRRARAPTAD